MNLNNNLFKRIFATTSVFATLLTTSVATTVHADSSNVPGSGTAGFTNGDSKQWAIDHGYLNPDGTPKSNNQNKQPRKTTIDAKTKRLGYTSRNLGTYNGYKETQIFQKGKTPGEIGTTYTLNATDTTYTRGAQSMTYIDGITGAVDPDGTIGARSLANQVPNPNNAKNFYNILYLSDIEYQFRNNKANPLSQYNKDHKDFINGTIFYHKWLHLNVNKAFSFKKQTTNPKNYYKTHKEPNIMDKGYSSTWLRNKLDWMKSHPEATFKEMNKAYKQSILKDQRNTSTKNDFDNTTTK